MPNWTTEQVPDLSDKTVLVTGANSGIGFAAARIFARAGAHVVLGCRDGQRGEQAIARIAAEAPAASVELLLLDLAQLASVREAAARVRERHSRLDLLCNNAGVMALPRTLTADGFEMQLGVNHFGHFALTGLLLPPLLASPGARVITVTSSAHRIGTLRFDDLDGTRRYNKWRAYGQSKLANLLFSYELQRRLEASDASAISVACHPGYADTNLQDVGPTLMGSPMRRAFYRLGNRWLAQSAEQGAWPTVYAATATDVRGGDYIGPGGLGHWYGAPVHVQSSRASHDAACARRLWDISIERTAVDYAALTRQTRASTG